MHFLFHQMNYPSLLRRFIVLVDDDSVQPALDEYVAQWPDNVRKGLILNYRPIFQPDEWHFINLYEKCATEKLFLPWALPEIDSVIYLDTDHVFLRPPDHLTEQFKHFDDKQVLGVAPVDGYYLQHNIEVNPSEQK
jgi:UDP-xylose:glucoside alpha-1,3-xylosyltransferase